MKYQARDGILLDTIQVSKAPDELAFNGSNIWVANGGDGTVTKLRPTDGASCTYIMGQRPMGLAFDGSNIWVANNNSNNVTKLRAKDGIKLGTLNAGKDPTGIVFDEKNTWVTNFYSKSVTKLRASDGSTLATISVADGPAGVAFVNGHIWVTNHATSSITQIDHRAGVGVIVASVIMLTTGWYYADPLISAGIGLFILPRTWMLLRDAVEVLLEGTPADVNLAALREAIKSVAGVLDVHDLHVWSLTSGAQMAFWFLLICVCFLSLGLVTGDYDTIGYSQFVLAVISSLTAVGSRVVSIVSPQGVDEAPRRSKGFFIDLLSDSNGVRFQRFQLCAWTLLLGLIFAATVYDDLVMPNFGDSLLSLVGISAAAHVGFTYLEQERSTSLIDRQNR